MTILGSNAVAFMLIDGHSVAGLLTTITESKDAVTEEAHGFSEEWIKHASVGLSQISLTQAGYFDDAENAIHDALVSKSGMKRIVSYIVEGNAQGKECVNWEGALQVKYNRILSRGELHKVEAEYAGAGKLLDGILLQPLGVVVDPGQGASIDTGTSPFDKITGIVQVVGLSLDGYTDVQIFIEDSADNSSFAPVVSFSVMDAGDVPIAEIKSAANPRRYLRAAWDYSGTGTAPEVEIMVSVVLE